MVIINREKPMRIGELPNTFTLFGRGHFTYCLYIPQTSFYSNKGEKTPVEIKGYEYRSKVMNIDQE